jgi:altronate dehydratase small subunit
MGHDIQKGADALIVDPKDHVATALRDLKQGETVRLRTGEQAVQVIALDEIPFGHKIAIIAIAEGTSVCKYGEVIGRATSDIQSGQHVHVHNLEGIRGRGDQAKTGGEPK